MLFLVESWWKSDKTQIEFAREHGLAISKFRYWVHKCIAQNRKKENLVLRANHVMSIV